MFCLKEWGRRERKLTIPMESPSRPELQQSVGHADSTASVGMPHGTGQHGRALYGLGSQTDFQIISLSLPSNVVLKF